MEAQDSQVIDAFVAGVARGDASRAEALHRAADAASTPYGEKDLLKRALTAAARVAGPAGDLLDRKPLDLLHRPDLGPLLHLNHPLPPDLDRLTEPGSKSHRTLSPPSEGGQFSTGERGSVLRRRRQPCAGEAIRQVPLGIFVRTHFSALLGGDQRLRRLIAYDH